MNRAQRLEIEMRRLHESPPGDHNGNWAISYGDMVTLLLAFFVLFFSLGSDSKDIEILEGIVKNEFKKEQEVKPEVSWGRDANAPKGAAEGSGAAPDIATSIQGNKLLIEFPNVSFFKTAQTELTNEGSVVLTRFASKFKGFAGKMRLVIRGYTDNRPVKASRHIKFADNLELSSLRAISALRALNKEGIPFQLMRIGGYGETDKATKISDADQQRYDRKIVIVVEPLDKTERGVEEVPSRNPEPEAQLQDNENEAVE